MSREGVQVVREVFDAQNRQDFERSLALLANDAELLVAGSLLEPGTYSGREDVARWFGEWFRSFEPGYRFEIEEILEVGDAVVVAARHHGRGKLSGADIDAVSAYAFWVRGGTVARVELHDELDEALEAARGG